MPPEHVDQELLHGRRDPGPDTRRVTKRGLRPRENRAIQPVNSVQHVLQKIRCRALSEHDFPSLGSSQI